MGGEIKRQITLDHGSGGLKTRELIEGLFLKRLNNPFLSNLEDSATIEVNQGRIAFTTDSYVVDPIRFPGGDIGSLSVHGTINDLAMKGAWPVALSLSFVLEEGFSFDELDQILASIESASKKAGVPIVTGDTKVVPRGKGDKIFINTSGIGIIPDGVDVGYHRIQSGDVIIVSGSIGDHGVTILTQREGLGFSGDLKSDTMALHGLVKTLLEEIGPDLHCLRDPTRGGVATVLVELAERTGLSMEIDEVNLPIRDEAKGATEILGLDPLYLANEGKLVAWVSESSAERAVEIMRQRIEGKEANIIGKVLDGKDARVTLNTIVGGKRAIYALTGNPLPRIC